MRGICKKTFRTCTHEGEWYENRISIFHLARFQPDPAPAGCFQAEWSNARLVQFPALYMGLLQLRDDNSPQVMDQQFKPE